jgi:ATP-binding cassette subfamily B protein
LLFGKHINRYYLRYLPSFLVGLAALILVDYVQLVQPKLYRAVVNGLTYGTADLNGVTVPFDMDYLLDHVCLPMIYVILLLVVGRFLWRVCFRTAAIRMETHLRGRMFDRCKDLSQQYYQVNKVGNMMALFTNDLETVQDCFG